LADVHTVLAATPDEAKPIHQSASRRHAGCRDTRVQGGSACLHGRRADGLRG
jgi:hypothetical protein